MIYTILLNMVQTSKVTPGIIKLQSEVRVTELYHNKTSYKMSLELNPSIIIHVKDTY
jgi:hypothetical protein